MDKKEAIFPKGIFYNKPREGAPDFIRGSISIKADEAIEFINQYKNASGYVNLDMKLSREKRIYLELNTFTPTKRENAQPETLQPQTTLSPDEREAIKRLREQKKPQETGRNSDNSFPPNFDRNEIDAEKVFESWNEPRK